MDWNTEELKEMIACCGLTLQEECVLKLCLTIRHPPLTPVEIGALIGTSPDGVREIEMAALRKLRDWPSRRQNRRSEFQQA